MTAVLSEIIEILTGGLVGMAQGIGAGLTALVSNIFLDTTNADAPVLSVFGGVIVIFAGIGLAVSLSRLVVMWVSSLGGKSM